jgi:hypothetical protein
VPYERGNILPGPSLIFTKDMLEAFVSAACHEVPPGEAVERHLKDALSVRDRLLTLVEKRI